MGSAPKSAAGCLETLKGKKKCLKRDKHLFVTKILPLLLLPFPLFFCLYLTYPGGLLLYFAASKSAWQVIYQPSTSCSFGKASIPVAMEKIRQARDMQALDPGQGNLMAQASVNRKRGTG